MGLACVLGAWAHVGRAASLFGASERAFEALGTSPSPHNRVDSDRSVAATRASADEAIFVAAWAEGRAMTLEQAVAHALDKVNSS